MLCYSKGLNSVLPYLFYFSLLLLSSNKLYSQCGSNLVLNSSFENGTQNWSLGSNTNFSIGSGPLATDGNQYLVFNQVNNSFQATVTQSIPITENTFYYISFNGASSADCDQQLIIRYKASNGVVLLEFPIHVDHLVSSGFLSDFFTLIQSPLNATSLELEFYVSTCGVMYVDELCVSSTIPSWECYAGSDLGFDALYGVDISTNTSGLIGSFGSADEIESMSFDPTATILYAVNENTLGTIDVSSGAFTPCVNIIGIGDGPQGVINFNDIDGLAWDFTTNTLLASARRSGVPDVLLRIDPNTCQVVQNAFGANEYVEIVGFNVLLDIDDITFQPSTGLLYASNTRNGGQLITIDRNTGQANVIGSFNVEDLEGLSFSSDGTLYGTTGWRGDQPNSYFTIDVNTGNANYLGTFVSGEDFESIQCLVEPVTGSLCGTVYEDLNDDDIGDVGLPYVTILLYDIDGNLVGSTLTDVDGSYCFLDIIIGTYNIEEIDPGQFVSVVDIDGGDPNFIRTIVLGGQTITGNDFVDEREDCLTNWSTPIVVNENTETCIEEIVVFDVAANDIDAFGADLTYSITNGGDFGTVSITEDGILTYIPSSFFVGAENISYQACIQDFDPCLSYGPYVCDEGITEMTVVYTGTDLADINLSYSNTNLNFQNFFNVAPGDTLAIDSPLENWSWDIFVDGVFDVTLITDCTHNYLAQNQGSFFILAFVDDNNAVNDPLPILPHCDYGFITIDVAPNPVADAGSNVAITCDQSILIGGDPVGNIGAEYSWSNSGGSGTISNFNNGQILVSPTATTVYTLTIESGGCFLTDQVLVVVNDLGVDLGLPNQIICENESITLTPSINFGIPPFQYLWNNGSTNPSITVSPNANTSYNVVVTDATQCSGTDNVNIFVNTNPNIFVGLDQTISCSSSVTLGENPVADIGANYTWSNGQTGIVSSQDNGQITVSPNATTTYTLSVSANGCTSIGDVIVTVDELNVEVGDATQNVCLGIPATFTAVVNNGQSPYQYLWSNGSTSSSITVTPNINTTYSVEVTDALGCLGTEDVFAIVNPNPSIDAGPDQTITCSGSSIIGGDPVGINAATYAWSTGQTGIISLADNGQIMVSPQVTTTYTLTITTVGCEVTEEVTVTVDELDIELGDATQNVCLGIPVTFTAIVNNGQGPYQYLWSDGSTTPSITVSPIVNTTYNVTITDALGCIGSDEVLAIVNPNPSINVGANQTITCGGSVTIGGDPVGIIGATYTWSTGQTGIISVADNGQISVNPQISTTYQLLISTIGCEVTEEITVTVEDLNVELGDDTQDVCIGVPTTFTASVNNGQAPFQYLWSNGSVDASITVTSNVNTSFSVVVTDGLGCSGMDEVLAIVNPAPFADAGQDGIIYCSGDLLIGADSIGPEGTFYEWSNGFSGVVSSGDNGQLLVSPTTSTSYYLTITNAYCSVFDTVEVLVEKLTVDIGADNQTLCAALGDSLVADVQVGQAPYTYLWSTGETSQVIAAETTGQYDVLVTDANACTGTASSFVNIDDCPAVVCGNLYFDTNGNGFQDPGEPDLTNVDVIITNSEGNVQTVTTQIDPDGDLNGVWCAVVTPGQVIIDVVESDPDFPSGVVQTEGTDPTVAIAIANEIIDGGTDGYTNLGFVCGHIYFDTNANGIQDPNEPDIPHIDVLVIGSDGIEQIVVSDSEGNYCAGVIPGPAIIDIDEQDLDFPMNVIQTEGEDPNTVFAILGETIDAGTDGYTNDAEVCGNVYFDTNANGTQDPGEPDLGNIDVIITDALGNTQTVQTQIDPDGDLKGVWCATVIPGIITIDIVETDPDFPTGSTQTEGDDPTVILVVANTTTDGGTDGFALVGFYEGIVYHDANSNYNQDPTELGLENLDIVITNSKGEITTLVTDVDGHYSGFGPAGLYLVDVDENDTDMLVDSWQTEGEDPNSFIVVVNQTIDAGDDGFSNQTQVCGHIYFDTNTNGTQDPGEPDLTNIDVIITDSNGDIQTAITQVDPDGDQNGVWCAYVNAGEIIIDIDDTDPDFPNESTQTEGDDPTIITAIIGTVNDGGTDGFALVGNFFGNVYFDLNGNFTRDSGENGISNININITNPVGETFTLTTDANGDYAGYSLPGLNIIDVNDTDADFPFGLTQTEGDDPSFFITSVGTTVNAGNDGYTQLSTVCGNIYFDTNGNGTQDAGEPDLPSIDVIITDEFGNAQTVQTQIDPDGDLNGVWCADVPPGIITIDIDETDPDFPDGTTQTEGDDPTTILLIGGTTIDGGTDGFALLGGIYGTVYLDDNANGVFDNAEQGIGNLDVIITDATGYVQTVKTLANGIWSANVAPGAVTIDVDETDVDYPSGSSQTEGTDPSTAIAILGETVDAGNDGYAYTALVCGNLYFDANGNGIQDSGEPDLPEVDVIITHSSGYSITVTTANDPDGDMNGIWCATVTEGEIVIDVDETDPDYPTGSTQTEGDDPTVVQVTLGQTFDGGTDGYALFGSICGHVYFDTNGNGIQDGTESGLADVDVIITDANGQMQTVITGGSGQGNDAGFYCATVPPGLVIVDVNNNDPDFPFGAIQTEGEDPTIITAIAGLNINAGEDGFSLISEVCGLIYLDSNGNGIQDSGEPELPNVNVVITDQYGYSQTVTTQVDPDGDLNGIWCAYVAQGDIIVDIDNNDPDLPDGSIQTEGDDPTFVTVVIGQVNDGGTDGYALVGQVCGLLYEDINANGIQDNGEPGLPNVDLLITNANGVTQTITTLDLPGTENGTWCATIVSGPAIIDIDETDPDYPTGATQTAGDDPTNIIVLLGQSIDGGVDGFAYLAEVCGNIYYDTNGNGMSDPGEPDLPGIDVIITDSFGNMQTVETQTDPDGDLNGVWCALVPLGTIIIDIDETDPDFPDGLTQTEGDDPSTFDVILNQFNNTGSDGYTLFAELCGHVYLDNDNNGTQNSGDEDLQNVDVIITDALGNTQTVSTNIDGDYCAFVVQGLTNILVDETDPEFPFGAVVTEGTNPMTLNAIAGLIVNADTIGYYESPGLCGRVFEDVNSNGFMDPNEPGIAHITVIVADDSGLPKYLHTDADGYYCTEVVVGGVFIDVDNSDPDFPLGAVQTQGLDPNFVSAPANGYIDAGTDGYNIVGYLCGNVYFDNNASGSQDANEPGLANLDVIITDFEGGIQIVSTDDAGLWCANVLEGTTVIELDQTDPDYPIGSTQTEGDDPTTVDVIIGQIVDGGADGFLRCLSINSKVFIEGALSDADGDFTYGDLMRTDLNDLQLLPGQTYIDPLFGNHYFPAGQPYTGAPWFYDGTEGDAFDSENGSSNSDANYPPDVVDWILVSVRVNEDKDSEICKAAALLKNDGSILFVEEFECCGFVEESFYLVAEHRNHLVVMSKDPVVANNGTIDYDFSVSNSYVDFFGLGNGQKLVDTPSGAELYIMYSGNGKQSTSSAATDINVNDKIVWESDNNRSAVYIAADYNLSGDTNVNDKGMYDINNNSFSSVPYN